MYDDFFNYNTENPLVRDELWNNEERYEPDGLPYGYSEFGLRLYLENLSRDQKDKLTSDLKACAASCEFEVDVKRYKDYVVIDGIVSYDEEEKFGEIWEEYEDYGILRDYF